MEDVIERKRAFVEQIQKLAQHPELVLVYQLSELLDAAQPYKACFKEKEASPKEIVCADPVVVWIEDVLESLEGLDKADEIIETVTALCKATWPQCSTKILREVTHFFAAIVRAATLSVEAADMPDMSTRVSRVFSLLRFDRTNEALFIHGLAHAHQPSHSSWDDDCAFWREKLSRRIKEGHS